MKEFASRLDANMASVADVLIPSLELAVPLHMWELRNTPDNLRIGIAHDCADVVAAHGDVLMFGGKRCAAAFNALARGIAAGAYQPGGVTVFGKHWCVDHAACLAAEAHAAPHPLPALEPEVTEPVRPVVNVYLPGDAPGRAA